MKRGMIIAIVLVAVLAIGGALMAANKDNKTTDSTATQTHNEPKDEANTNHQSTDPGASSQSTEQSTQNTVEIKDFVFSPSKITIKKGTTVTWTNKDSASHTVTSDNDSAEVFDSPLMPQNDTFSHTFNKTGTFGYHCQPHPNMTASVTVID